MKHLVLFDVGGVLVKINFWRFYEEAGKLAGTTEEDFRKEYFASGLEAASLEGRINKTEYFAKLRKMIGKEIPDEELKILCGYRLGGPIREVIEIKRRVHEAGYAVGIFPNSFDIGAEIISKSWPEVMETYGGPRIYSFEVGSIKPHPEMYQQVRGFDSVTLIDDKESYLRTGIEQFGWNGILFTPYIDESEAIRAVHKDKTTPSKNFRKADSAEELVEALAHFGIKI